VELLADGASVSPILYRRAPAAGTSQTPTASHAPPPPPTSFSLSASLLVSTPPAIPGRGVSFEVRASACVPQPISILQIPLAFTSLHSPGGATSTSPLATQVATPLAASDYVRGVQVGTLRHRAGVQGLDSRGNFMCPELL
jgi:hypothetical protein